MATNAQLLADQEALWTSIEAIAEPRLQAAFEDMFLRVAERYRVTGNPLPPDDLRREIEEILRELWSSAIRTGGQYVVNQFDPVTAKSCWPMLETKAEDEAFWDKLIQLFIEAFGSRKIVQITETTRNQIRRVISAGEKQGLGVQGIADQLVDVSPKISKLRAHVIARTETHTASNYASTEVAKASRLPLMKEWVSAEDSRTRTIEDGDRYDHADMSGTTVELDQPFKVPKKDGTLESIFFPGDPDGSAANIINCRCAQVHKIKK